MYCEICRGSQMIRLPRYRRLVAVTDSNDIEKAEAAYKDFPCPECAPLTAKDKVRVVECHAEADSRYEDNQGYREHVIRAAIGQLAHEIERAGFARIQESPADTREFKRKYRVSVGVVDPRVVAALDAERHAAEEAFASLVINIAAQEIDNWGSYYGHSEILKSEAKTLLGSAIRLAKETRPRAVA